MSSPDHRKTLACSCKEIQAKDESRHFRGCAMRELFPEPIGAVSDAVLEQARRPEDVDQAWRTLLTERAAQAKLRGERRLEQALTELAREGA